MATCSEPAMITSSRDARSIRDECAIVAMVRGSEVDADVDYEDERHGGLKHPKNPGRLAIEAHMHRERHCIVHDED